jgi:hypothetical protein
LQLLMATPPKDDQTNHILEWANVPVCEALGELLLWVTLRPEYDAAKPVLIVS